MIDHESVNANRDFGTSQNSMYLEIHNSVRLRITALRHCCTHSDFSDHRKFIDHDGGCLCTSKSSHNDLDSKLHAVFWYWIMVSAHWRRYILSHCRGKYRRRHHCRLPLPLLSTAAATAATAAIVVHHRRFPRPSLISITGVDCCLVGPTLRASSSLSSCRCRCPHSPQRLASPLAAAKMMRPTCGLSPVTQRDGFERCWGG